MKIKKKLLTAILALAMSLYALPTVWAEEFMQPQDISENFYSDTLETDMPQTEDEVSSDNAETDLPKTGDVVSEDNIEADLLQDDEANDSDGNYVIAPLSLYDPVKKYNATITLDRSAGLPDGLPSDNYYAFYINEVLTEALQNLEESDYNYLIENDFITESGTFKGDVTYSYNDDDYEKTTWDGYIDTDSSRVRTSTNMDYVYVYFLSSDDQLNREYVSFYVKINFKFFEDGETINAVIDRTGGMPEGFKEKSKNFYVHEILKEYLSNNNMLNASGEFDGNIYYLTSSSAKNYTKIGWNDIISSGYSSYYFVLGGNGVYSGTHHSINITYKFADNEFAKNLQFVLYNSDGEKINNNYTSTTEYSTYTYKSTNISNKKLKENESPRFLVTLPEGYSTDNVQVYNGFITDESALSTALNITANVINNEATYEMSKYSTNSFSNKLTFVVTDDNGSKLLSCVEYYVKLISNSASLNTSGIPSSINKQYEYLYSSADGKNYLGRYYVYDINSFDDISVHMSATYVDNFDKNGTSLSKIDYACLGLYNSKDDAVKDGASDIKEQLFVSSTNKGTLVDFSKCRGVTAYTNKGVAIQIKYVDVTIVDIYGNVFTDTDSFAIGHIPSNETTFNITNVMKDTGKVNEDGSKIKESYSKYKVSSLNDDYCDNGYQTLFILDHGAAVEDGTVIYPVFTSANGSLVNVDGITGYQISGESPISLESGKALQYSVGSEDGSNRSNYWVTFVTQQKGPKLFVNATNYSGHYSEKGNPQRELFIDSQDNSHDILIANIGDEQLKNITIKLNDDSNCLKLDDYWTILDDSVRALASFTSTSTPSVSKIRLLPIDEDKFSVISGSLIISADENDPVTIELTGIAGTPKITTENLVDGVKYVPYSCVIMTNSMYNSDIFKFSVTGGKLPQGISLKENGELYGIPKESGTFTFTVQAKYLRTSNDGTVKEYSASQTYTLTIKDNEDSNVDATNNDEQGHPLVERVSKYITVYYSGTNNGNPIVDRIEIDSDLFWSEGALGELQDFYIDGIKLTSGSDYTAEEGSTKITVRAQTFGHIGITGSDVPHTLAAEFRTEDNNELKRSAQNVYLNYKTIDNGENNPDNNPGNTGNNGNTGGSSGSSSTGVNTADNSNPVKENGSVNAIISIVDANGEPVSGISLELHSKPKYASTDNSGTAAFDSVEFGRHTLYIKESSNDKAVSKTFSITSGSGIGVNGSVITASAGDTVHMTIEYDGSKIKILSVAEDVSSASGVYSDAKILLIDLSKNALSKRALCLILLFTVTITVFIIRKKIKS